MSTQPNKSSKTFSVVQLIELDDEQVTVTDEASMLANLKMQLEALTE